jgi:integrase
VADFGIARSTSFAAGLPPIQPEMHFHDLRHTHETWLVEDHVPRVLRLQRLGHKRKDIDDFYAHVTPAMRETMLTALQQRWEHSGGQGVAQLLEPARTRRERF